MICLGSRKKQKGQHPKPWTNHILAGIIEGIVSSGTKREEAEKGEKLLKLTNTGSPDHLQSCIEP